MIHPPAQFAGIAQADSWPTLPVAHAVSQERGRLVAWGSVPQMDNTGRDYLFEVRILTADPRDGEALARLASVAVSEFPRFVEAMLVAQDALASVRRSENDGDSEQALEKLREAITAAVGITVQSPPMDEREQGPSVGLPYSVAIGSYLKHMPAREELGAIVKGPVAAEGHCG